MRKSKIVAISSSISEKSKTAMLLSNVVSSFDGDTYDTTVINLRDIPADMFFKYPTEDPVMTKAFADVSEADGLIFATPIYKASFSGLLKSFLDLLPQFAFSGKVVLPLATGGSLAHVLALDYSLRPVIQSMGARHIVQSYFLPEREMQVEHDQVTLSPEAQRCVSEAIHHFKTSISSSTNDPLLGHPRPDRSAAVAS